ncbi:hypothetical protein NKI32_02295 [Mesorhizobium sp. M0761]|uniref:hypothetical protein n=1 Tax=unclassified Mesorhizobium TaxID=325217 RepID=UPI0033386FDA
MSWTIHRLRLRDQGLSGFPFQIHMIDNLVHDVGAAYAERMSNIYATLLRMATA